MEQFKAFPLNPSVMVGNYGTIIKPNGRQARQSNHSLGYLSVGITIDGKVKVMKSHRVIAMAWIENPQNKATVNHIDGNKKNNRADNLEWLTLSENHLHAWRTGLQDRQRMVRQATGRVFTEATRQKLRENKLGRKRVWIDGKHTWTPKK